MVRGHEGGHAEEQQHEGLDGQRRPQHAAEETVPGCPSVHGVAAQAIVSTGKKKTQGLVNATKKGQLASPGAQAGDSRDSSGSVGVTAENL